MVFVNTNYVFHNLNQITQICCFITLWIRKTSIKFSFCTVWEMSRLLRACQQEIGKRRGSKLIGKIFEKLVYKENGFPRSYFCLSIILTSKGKNLRHGKMKGQVRQLDFPNCKMATISFLKGTYSCLR